MFVRKLKNWLGENDLRLNEPPKKQLILLRRLASKLKKPNVLLKRLLILLSKRDWKQKKPSDREQKLRPWLRRRDWRRKKLNNKDL